MKVIIVYIVLILFSSLAAGQTDGEIAQKIISESISSYPGNCACPYNSASNGYSCGKRSAWSRGGGHAPYCYKSDVSAEQIHRWKSTHGIKNTRPKKVSQTLHEEVAATLPTGSFSKLYARKDWEHWIDLDGDCQNERAETLIRLSTIDVTFQDNRNCAVSLGSWADPYTGRIFTNASALDIDHIVPLAWANGHGGSEWSKNRKKVFANDHKNLLPVDASTNRSKGNKGPDEWMPPNQSYRCEYLNRFNKIVISYSLMYTPSEKRIVDKMKTACKL